MDATAGIEVTGVRRAFVAMGSPAATPESLNECYFQASPDERDLAQQAQAKRESLNAVHAVWPYGFVFLGLIGAGSTWVAVRRLRTPIRKLPRGTRIANLRPAS
jgi:ABC-2 type transport system permease protein